MKISRSSLILLNPPRGVSLDRDMRYFLKKWIFIFIALFLYSSCPGGASQNNMEKMIKDAFRDYSGDYLIYVNKNDFSLSIYNKKGEAVKRYKIGYGLNPDKRPKLFAGDNRTPEGIYKITEILSIDADPASDSCKNLKAMNSVYFKAEDGHYKFGKKDADLGKNAYGPRFFRIDYPADHDYKRYDKAKRKGEIPESRGKIRSIGSGIAIHGNNDPPSIGELCSSGCIRMYNEDIAELDEFTEIGTPVIIVNSPLKR